MPTANDPQAAGGAPGRRVPAAARAAGRAGARQPHPPRHHGRRGDGGRTVDDLIGARSAAKAGVDRLVQVGVDVASSRWGVGPGRPRDGAVVATVALHPNEAPRLSDLDEALREIEALAGRPAGARRRRDRAGHFRTGDGRARGAGGELPRRTSRSPSGTASRWSSTTATRTTTCCACSTTRARPDTVVLHCFSGDAEFAAECVRRGLPAQLRRHGHVRERRRRCGRRPR